MACKSIWDIDDNQGEDCKPGYSIGSMDSSFQTMKLDSSLIKALNCEKFCCPRQVQIKVIEHFSGRTHDDLIVHAPCKSGKTSAIILAVVNQLLLMKSVGNCLRAIMICPTFELSKNSFDLAAKLTKYCPYFKIALAVASQKKFNLNNVDFLIGTSEKVYESINTFCAKKIKFFIIDEADEIICSSYSNRYPLQFRNILHDKCCTVFSTSSKTQFLNSFLDKFYPVAKLVEVSLEISAMKFVKQIYLVCETFEEKLDFLLYMKSQNSYPGQMVIICQAKESITDIHNTLKKKNYIISILSGALTLNHRKIVIEQFKKGEIKDLLITPSFLNVISFEFVSKLVNFDQILDKDTFLLDLTTYKKRSSVLMGSKGLIVNLIEEKWASFFFKNSKISNGKTYFNDGEVINYVDFKAFYGTLK